MLSLGSLRRRTTAKTEELACVSKIALIRAQVLFLLLVLWFRMRRAQV